MHERIRVAVADDHRLLRETTMRLISDQPDMELVGAAEDGRGAIDLAAQHCPDVILMDLSMPGGNGIGATREIRTRCPHVRVVAFSMLEGQSMAEIVRRAGAVDYVVKGSDPEVLLAAIRTAAALMLA